MISPIFQPNVKLIHWVIKDEKKCLIVMQNQVYKKKKVYYARREPQSQPLSLIMWESSIMYFPSLYF